MAINDVYKLTMTQRMDANLSQNTIYLRKISSGDPTAAQLGLAADAFKEVFRPHQSNAMTWDTWTATQVNGGTTVWAQPDCRPTGGLAFAGGHTGTLVGSRIDERGPPQAAIVHTLITAYAGRRRRGRLYQAGLTNDQFLGGVVTGSEVTALAAKWVTFFGLYGPSGSNADFKLCVFSQVIASGCVVNKFPPPKHTIVASPNPGDAARDVIAIRVNTTVYTQRRRTLGQGI